jgi:hypothetical protein
MGFFRKATWVATGGVSGLAVKANSKKARTANAMEQQNQLLRERIALQQQLADGAVAATPPASTRRVAPPAPVKRAAPARSRPMTLKDKRLAKQERKNR